MHSCWSSYVFRHNLGCFFFAKRTKQRNLVYRILGYRSFFFLDDVIIFPDSFPNLVYTSWLWQISHGIWANLNKREIFWKITSMRLACFKFKYKPNSPFFTLSCLSRGIPNIKVCLSLMNPSLYLNGCPLYHLVLYRLGSKSFSVQFHRESLLST